MKAIVTITAGLILVSTTFAQSSRRSETKENNSQSNRRTESVSTERRTSSDRSNDNRTEATEKKASDNRSADRRTESTSSPSGTNESNNRRSETVTNTSRTVENNSNRNNGDDRRGSSDRKNNGYGNDNHNSTTRVYDNNHSGNPDNRGRVEEQHTVRTVEPRHHYVDRKSYRPVPVEVRREKYPYRHPVRPEVVWTVELSRNFEVYYPAYRPYHYHYGMRLASIAAYDAFDYVGEIVRVYGRVVDTFYSPETDEYFLYFGDFYPYQDFSVVIPGREARDFSPRPERFFDREYIEVTGLVTRFEAKPEMVVKRSTQIAVY